MDTIPIYKTEIVRLLALGITRQTIYNWRRGGPVARFYWRMVDSTPGLERLAKRLKNGKSKAT
mgnify:CR=1 FL=1